MMVGLKFKRTPYSLNMTLTALLPEPLWTTGTGNSPPARKLACCPFIAIRFGSARARNAPFVFIGLTYWAFVNQSVSYGCRSFHTGKTYIRQRPAPMAIYPLRTVFVAAAQLLIAIVATLPLAFWLSGTPLDLPLLTLPFALVLLLVIGWSLAVLDH